MTMSLLIVDDSDLIRTSLRALLGSVAGITSIREASTLGEALDNIIQRLKQLSPTLWLAVLTIHADPFYRQHCLALGADWFFDKATETDSLLELVHQLAAQNPTIHPNPGNLP